MTTRLILFAAMLFWSFSSYATTASRLFTTSRCFDMIASLQYFDKIKDEPRFKSLLGDSIFTRNLDRINDNVTASKLCNFYATFNGNRDCTDSCTMFFSDLKTNNTVTADEAGWIKNIVSLQPELSYCLNAINDAGYPEYWSQKVKPMLEEYIESYPVSDSLLNTIHAAMTDFSGPEGLSETRSRTYVLNIDNAFNLSDESFCCTPLLLDPELEKQFRLDFLKVYTHENLHRLNISNALITKLKELKADDFYRENEAIANNHREGLNEAFVVAAEVYISHKIGHRDAQSVYDEFKEYVDGSLVLAPIIYVHLNEKRSDESLNDFILRLFDNGTIKVGNVKAQYDKAMHRLLDDVHRSKTNE